MCFIFCFSPKNVWSLKAGTCVCFVHDGSDSKEFACKAGDPGSIPGLGRYPGEGSGYSLQYSCLEKSMDRGDCHRLPAWEGCSFGQSLASPRFKLEVKGLQKFAASAVICKFLWFGRARRVLREARLPWLKLRLQFPSQGAQGGQELWLPRSGEQLDLGAWKSDHQEPSGLHCGPLCFFLWAVSSLLLLPLLPCPGYKEEKVSHHFSSTRIKSSPAAVTHPMTVSLRETQGGGNQRTLCASGEWGRLLLDAYLRKNFDDSRSYIFLYIEKHEKSWTWDVCSLWLAVVFCCSTACFSQEKKKKIVQIYPDPPPTSLE